MNQHLFEAFDKLAALNEETFSIDKEGLDDYEEFKEKDEFEDIVDVIDPKAEDEDELEDSYVGKIILDCCTCHSKLYKDEEDVHLNDDGTVANEDEECPYCFTSGGFKIIGKVAECVADFDETDKEDKEEDANDEVFEKEEDKVEIKEDLGSDIGKYQKWVDYDMKRYGKISHKTNRLVKEAGLEIVKDDHGDYEVIAHEDMHEDIEPKYVKELIEMVNNCRSKTDLESIGADLTSFTDDKIASILDGKITNDDIEAMFGGYSFTDDDFGGLNESIENLSMDTEDTHMEMTSDEGGKVTITTEPKSDKEENEVIEPITDDDKVEIEKQSVEDLPEDEIEIDEFDEESFDELGESYLKKIYENVNSFKTTNVAANDKHLMIEGVINFKSGNTKKTTFLFESKQMTKTGKVKFMGENREITKGKKAFVVTGTVDNGKLLSESLTCNYRVKDNDGKSKRLYCTVKRGK